MQPAVELSLLGCGLQTLSSWKDQDTGENGASEENQVLLTVKLNGTENGNQHDSQRKNQEQTKEMVNDELNINKNQVIVINSNCGLQALSSWNDQDTGENGASDNREQMKPRGAQSPLSRHRLC